MTASYRVTPTAKTHLNDIAEYTLQEFGSEQMEVYLRALFSRFEWLSENPRLGKARNEIFGNLRSYREGAHVIFYRISGTFIDIVAILHRSRDVDRFFGN